MSAGTSAPSSSSLSTSTPSSYLPLDSLKSKLVSLKSDLSSKDAQLAAVRHQLSQSELAHVAALTKLQDSIASQKREYESLLASNQEFVEKILQDKKELAERCEALSEKYVKVEEDFRQQQSQFRKELLHTELSKAKEVWAAGEKLTREKYLQEKTKLIKVETLRGVEKDVQKVLATERAKLVELESTLDKKHHQHVLDLRSDHESIIASIRKQHANEIEHAREEERVEKQKKIRETIEKYDQLMMEQRVSRLKRIMITFAIQLERS